MRSVITGGAGFIGSHLCEALLRRGAEVVAIDNFLTGSPGNVAHLAGPRFALQVADVSEPFGVEGPVDAVLHFASPASPIDYARRPIETLLAGSAGTRWALELARQKGARFLLASTSEVYGDPLVHPQPESYWGNVNPVGPRSCYDEAKRYAEALTMAFRRVHGLDTRIARIFNTYGPRMRLDDGRVVPAFVSQALAGADFTLFGDGSQTRSFCFVEDEVEGLLRLCDIDPREYDGLPVNVGNPDEMTVREFAEAVRRAAGGGGKIIHRPLPADDPTRRRPDITRARALLGWEPRTRLDEGLARTVAWFREKMQNQAK